MKNFRLTTLASVIVIAVSVTSAYAQNRPVQKQNGHSQVGGQNHDLNHRALRLAVKEIDQAIRIMKDCLPIYDGHRVNAINSSKAARMEILVGIFKEKMDNQAMKSETINDKDNKSQYSDDQIRKSNERMILAGRQLENAYSLLKRVQWDYEGHKAQSMKYLQNAGNEIRIALQPFGGVDAFKKSSGNTGDKRGGKGIPPLP